MFSHRIRDDTRFKGKEENLYLDTFYSRALLIDRTQGAMSLANEKNSIRPTMLERELKYSQKLLSTPVPASPSLFLSRLFYGREGNFIFSFARVVRAE